jgi:hypothetical protein
VYRGVGKTKRRSHHLRAMHEKGNSSPQPSLVCRQRLGGYLQGRHRMLVLAGQMQWATGGREDGEVRRLREELADHSRRVGQLLEVVQDQQHVSMPDVLEERWRRPALTRMPRFSAIVLHMRSAVVAVASGTK